MSDRRTSVKRAIFDAFYGGGKIDFGKAFAFEKHSVADDLESTWELCVLQSGTAEEGLRSDFLYVVRNADLF